MAAGPQETLPPLGGGVMPQQEGLAAQHSNFTEDQGVELMDVKDEEIQIEGKGLNLFNLHFNEGCKLNQLTSFIGVEVVF